MRVVIGLDDAHVGGFESPFIPTTPSPNHTTTSARQRQTASPLGRLLLASFLAGRLLAATNVGLVTVFNAPA